ncbi:MAG: hypothetical protein WA110_08735, partial [Anaerolineaceae bacterium]
NTPSATPGLAADSNPATPQPDWENLYTETNPVTDSQELIRILQDLYGRFRSQLDRPGWYRFYGAGDLGKRVTWVEIREPESGQFDGLLQLFDYPEMYASGFIFPASVIAPDGQIGFTRKTETMDAYYFEVPDDVFLVVLDLERNLDNLGYFTNDIDAGTGPFGHLELLRFINTIQNPVYDHGGAHSESDFEGWVGTYEGRPVFVLKMTTLYSGVLPMMESGERPVRDEEYTCFDLQNGGAIATKSDYWYQSGNSEVGDWWMINYHLVERFEMLPEREQQIYDEALRRLEAFNQSNTP